MPVDAPSGTTTLRKQQLLVFTVAGTPLNLTMLLAGKSSNPLPKMDTTVPAAPDEGDIEEIAGGGVHAAGAVR